MKRLNFFKSSDASKIAITSLRPLDWVGLVDGREIEFVGWILNLAFELQSFALYDSGGKEYPCDITLNLPAPNLKELYPDCAHAERCRMKIILSARQDLDQVLTSGLDAVATFKDGARLELGRFVADQVFAVLGEHDRMPTKTSSLRLLMNRGMPFGTIIDVGVQHGTPELIALFPEAPHVLFEPVSENYPFIKRNYDKIDYRLVEAAAYSETGTGSLTVSKKQNSSRLMSTVTRKAAAESREIATITLDDYFRKEKLPKPYYLKVDVDGNEPDVINGAQETLQFCYCVTIEASVTNISERIRLMEAADFILWDIVDFGYFRNILAHFDLIFLQKSLYHKMEFSQVGTNPVRPGEKKRFLH